MEHTANQAVLRGTLQGLPEFSHENHGRRFYRFLLEVPRLSGTVDTLPVIVRQEALNAMDLSGGERITAVGQLRSFNSHAPTGPRLLIFLFAESLETCDLPPRNEVQLSGVVCKAPVYRRTPLGREICDVMLAVPRAYRRSDYLPCILWGKTAQVASRCQVGDGLCLTGRFQSRMYRKVTEEGETQRTAYEISALTAEATAPDEAADIKPRQTP